MKTITIKKKHLKRTIITIIVLVIVVAIVGGLIKAGKNTETKSTDTGLYLEPKSDPAALSYSQTLPRAGESQVTTVPEKEAVLGTATEKVSEHSYPNRGFSFQTPETWKVIEVGGEVIVQAPNAKQYSIQAYSVKIQDLSALETYVKNLSNISSIENGFMSGREVLYFNVNGIYQRGIAFISNGKLFYLLGSDLEKTKIAETFKPL